MIPIVVLKIQSTFRGVCIAKDSQQLVALFAHSPRFQYSDVVGIETYWVSGRQTNHFGFFQSSLGFSNGVDSEWRESHWSVQVRSRDRFPTWMWSRNANACSEKETSSKFSGRIKNYCRRKRGNSQLRYTAVAIDTIRLASKVHNCEDFSRNEKQVAFFAVSLAARYVSSFLPTKKWNFTVVAVVIFLGIQLESIYNCLMAQKNLLINPN